MWSVIWVSVFAIAPPTNGLLAEACVNTKDSAFDSAKIERRIHAADLSKEELEQLLASLDLELARGPQSEISGVCREFLFWLGANRAVQMRMVPDVPSKRFPSAQSPAWIKRALPGLFWNDSAGGWGGIVPSVFLALAEKTSNPQVKDDLHWAAAVLTPEGVIEDESPYGSYFYLLHATALAYLNRFPRGRHVDGALKMVAETSRMIERLCHETLAQPNVDAELAGPKVHEEAAKALEKILVQVKAIENSEKGATVGAIQSAIRVLRPAKQAQTHVAETTPSQQPKAQFVQASVVNVREKPSDKANLGGKLRINTAVFVGEHRNGWVQVSYTNRSMPALTGWTREDMIGPAPVTANDAAQKAITATGPLDAVRWWERAVAIEPTKSDWWMSLKRAYATAGKVDLEQWVERVRSGKERTYLARCLDFPEGAKVAEVSQVALLGVVEASGEVRALTWGDGMTAEQQKATRTEVNALRLELAGIPWYVDEGYVLTGSPFPSPQVRVSGDGISLLLLGPCVAENEFGRKPSLYLSQPVRHVSLAAAPDFFEGAQAILRQLRKAAEKEHGPQVSEMWGMEQATLPESHIRDAYVCWGHAVSRGIFSRKGDLLSGHVWRSKSDLDPCDYGAVRHPWVQPLWGKDTWQLTVVMPTFYGDDTHGYSQRAVCFQVVSPERGFAETCVLTEVNPF